MKTLRKTNTTIALTATLLLGTVAPTLLLMPAWAQTATVYELPLAANGLPAGWKADAEWMGGVLTRNEEDGKPFLRAAKTPVIMTRTVDVPPGVERVLLTVEARLTGWDSGGDQWAHPTFNARFFDAQGKRLEGQLYLPLKENTAEWKTISSTAALPPGTKQLQVVIAHKGKSGQLDIRSFRFTPVELTPEQRAAAQKEAAQKALIASLPRRPDPKTLPQRGARIDESKVDETMQVSTAAGDIERAFAAATTQLNSGKSVRLSLAPGIHRPAKPLALGKLNDKGRDALFIIEGKGGTATLRGSHTVGFEPGTWTVVDAKKRIYRHDWQPNWGFKDQGYHSMSNLLFQRREMVTLGGKPLNQVIIENYDYRDPQGRVYDLVGLVVSQKEQAKGGRAWTYKGFAGLDALQPGTFAVAELGPGEKDFDNHAYPNSLLLRLPENVPSLEGATVEVSMLDHVLSLRAKNNVVLRDVAIEQAGSWTNGPINAALETNKWADNKYYGPILFERVSIRDNRGEAADLVFLEHATLRDVVMENNWRNAGEFDWSRHCVWQNVVARNNNLLGRRLGTIAKGGAGAFHTMMLYNIMFEKCRFDDNYGAGLRTDSGWEYVDLVDCSFSRNHGGGVLHEITHGPIRHTRSIINGNEGAGLFMLNARNLTLESCQLRDNGRAAISQYIMRERTNRSYVGDEVPGGWVSGVPILASDNMIVRNSVLTARGAESLLVERTPDVGSPSGYVQWYSKHYTGENNTFFNPDSPDVFQMTTTWKPPVFKNFKAWQQESGEKATSRWAKPPAAS